MADYGIDMQSGRLWYLYQARCVTTNTNAAGAAIVVDISVASGTVARLVSARVDQATAGTHTLAVQILDEDNNIMTNLGTAGAAAAAKSLRFPTIGTTGDTNTATSEHMIIGPGQKFTALESEASGQANDTLTIAITLLLSTATEPTWSKTRSGNAADTTIAASSISATNTLQAVVL